MTTSIMERNRVPKVDLSAMEQAMKGYKAMSVKEIQRDRSIWKFCLRGLATWGLAAAMGSAAAQAQSCAGMTEGQLTSLNGFDPFPANHAWNTDISGLPADVNSFNIINFIGANTALKADFGSGTYRKQTIGIPYQVVAGSQAKVDVKLVAYPNESDPGPMPIPANALIEGYPSPGTGDRHVLVLDKDGCWLYELYNANKSKRGGWSADAAVVWDMTATPIRPHAWTSADAAGLAIFPGLVRYDEVASGMINHAIRFTVPTTRAAYVAPASHWASSLSDPNAPPMGMRMRLRSTFDISGFAPEVQTILTAMKQYGIILADNGSGIYISGAPDSRWDNNNLRQLGNVTASDFEVVQMGTVFTPAYIPMGPLPVISSFTANLTTVSAGTPVTLNWDVTGTSYNIISPQVGPVRGNINMITIVPAKTTTYTLHSTNKIGRVTKTVTVTVQ